MTANVRNSSPRHRLWKGLISCRDGFSIVELLAVCVVLATLLSLALPVLVHARQSARQARCLVNARTTALRVLLYAAESRDAFPFAGFVPHREVSPAGDTLRLGGTRGLANGMWALLFPDEWQGPHWPATYRCPDDPALYHLPMYWVSSAFWLSPASLARGRTYADAIPFSTRVADVLHPASKSLLFEQVAYCSAKPPLDASIAQTPTLQSSVALVDGSARRLRRVDALPALWTYPLDATIEGVLGRDLP